MDLPQPKTQPLVVSDVHLSRLDLLVEEYDKQHVSWLKAVANGTATEDEYIDRMSVARKELVALILDTYAENCQLGSGYYENLVYSMYKQRIRVLDGTERAIARLAEDQRTLHNAHGEAFTHIDHSSIDRYMNLFGEIALVRTLMEGLGLSQDVDRVVDAIVHKELPTRGGAGQASLPIDVEFRTRPVKVDMAIKTTQKAK